MAPREALAERHGPPGEFWGALMIVQADRFITLTKAQAGYQLSLQEWNASEDGETEAEKHKKFAP